MTSSFRNALYTNFSTSKNYYGNVICNGSAQSTFEIHQWDFLKVTSVQSFLQEKTVKEYNL